MKILFLDVDGVLVRLHQKLPEGLKSWDCYTFNETLSLNLQHIIKETGAKIVISSSWRHSRELLRNAFHGSILNWNDVISFTPSDLGHGRGNEILTWINDYHKTCKNGEHITNWVSIDDSNANQKAIIRLGKFVYCNGKEGLTIEKMRETINILNN